MHYGTSEAVVYDPALQEDHLDQIRACHQVSRGCFFLVSVFF